MSRKSGSMATWAGMTSPAPSTRKTPSRPRKRSLAKAYPAIELTTSDTAVAVKAMSALLSRYRRMLSVVNTER